MNPIKKSRYCSFLFCLSYLIIFFSFFITQVDATTLENTLIAQELGWVSDNIGICKGYYQDPLRAYAHTPLIDVNQAFTDIHAAQSHFSFEGTSTLSGNVVITQPGRLLYADQVY